MMTERCAAIRPFIAEQPDALHPSTRKIIAKARNFSAATFAADYAPAERIDGSLPGAVEDGSASQMYASRMAVRCRTSWPRRRACAAQRTSCISAVGAPLPSYTEQRLPAKERCIKLGGA